MIIRAFLKGFFNIYCHLIYKMKVVGMENIPAEGACLICANHVSLLDAISFAIHTKRMFYPMAKEELFKNKISAIIMKDVGCFPVKRGKGDTAALDTAKDYLRKGEMVWIFPEGTRNLLLKGGKIKKGAAIIALSENVPIIPIGIQGNYKPFTKITLNIGKPITLEEYKTGEDLEPREIVKLTQKIQEEIVRLRDEDVSNVKK